MAKLVKMGGSGSLRITLPKDKLDERGLEAGDEVGPGLWTIPMYSEYTSRRRGMGR